MNEHVALSLTQLDLVLSDRPVRVSVTKLSEDTSLYHNSIPEIICFENCYSMEISTWRRHFSSFDICFLPARRYARTGLCDSDVSVCLSVRPSVRLSVARRYCASQSESRIVKCTPSDSPITLVSGEVWFIETFARGHPKGTCQMRVGWVFFGDFRPICRHISRKRCILDTKLL